ncbi:MAG: helix-turn-helix domain-containing protein [Prevotella sp.]
MPKERSTIQKGALKDSDTIQKSDSTIQKSDSTTQKSDSTTQKRESATQKDSLKDSNTIPKTDITTQKDSLKDSNTILKALEPIQAEVLRSIMAHPQTTREEIVDSIDGISFGGVKFIIAKLQKKGLLKRVGGRKHGELQVL